MKLSYKWLKRYINAGVDVKEISEKLTMTGSEVGSIEEYNDDQVMELEITSNRPDCLNVIGLAREVGAILNKDVVLPEINLPEEKNAEKKIQSVIKDKKLCPYYTLRVITNVQIKESCDKIKEVISAVGVRVVNNVVDITNFSLMESGQPMHAFDFDKITGDTIFIRPAKKNEKIITIDEEERVLEEGMLVIADVAGPIAIAGVMGGKKTEVTSGTKNILLESAYFDPISVRRAARKLGLSTDSSYRFERGVDLSGIVTSSHRASDLICKHTGGDLRQFVEAGHLREKEIIVKLRKTKIETILGVKIDDDRVELILTKLGMEVSSENDIFTVNVPSYREDIVQEVDLIEEIGRIYGYDNIPETMPKTTPQINRKEKSRLVLEKINDILVSLGAQQIMTYSLINEKAVNKFVEFKDRTVSLVNALSEEHKTLTPQLLDGMFKSLAWNLNRKNNNLILFETAKMYIDKGKDKYEEKLTLCIGISGDVIEDWKNKQESDFFVLKGMVSEVTQRLKVTAEYRQAQVEGFSNTASINLDTNIGFLGQARKSILKDYDIDQKVYIAHIDLTEIVNNSLLTKRYESIPKYPSSVRDMSILSDMDLPSDETIKIVQKMNKKLLKNIKLVDVYTGKNIENNKKSLTYSLEYGLNDRTLTDEEIETVHNKIKQTIQSKLKIIFR